MAEMYYYWTKTGAHPVAFDVFTSASIKPIEGKPDEYTVTPAFSSAKPTDWREWALLPTDDIQIIMLHESTFDALGRRTRVCMSGHDWYGFDRDSANIGATMPNPNEQITEPKPISRGVWLAGKLMDETLYLLLKATVVRDCYRYV